MLEQEAIRQPVALGIDFARDEFVFTFENLVFTRTPFIPQIRAILSVLQEAFDHPVDIEFAHDGTDLYLLQCRSQSYREESMPASIPKEIIHDQIIFSANRYISNGTVSEITHIVYVNHREYYTRYRTIRHWCQWGGLSAG